MEVLSYALGTWDSEQLGNHRVIVQVSETAAAVRVTIPWRRPDNHPEQKGLLIRSSATGETVANVYIRSITAECGEIAFQPFEAAFPAAAADSIAVAGVYEVYYMQFEGTTRAPYPVITYPGPEAAVAQIDPDWAAAARRDWDNLPAAAALRIEAAGPLHSWYPMEVIATAGETVSMIAAHPDADFLLFPETRDHSIRMRQAIPQHWAAAGPFNPFTAEVLQGEFFVFQLGVFAHRRELQQTTLRFDTLIGTIADPAAAIGADCFTCFNLEGTSYDGHPFATRIDIPAGTVQAFWVGLDIDPELPPGTYQGTITVAADQTTPRTIPLTITVSPGHIDARGDDEPERLSRLRWLNSTLGSAPDLIQPYQPITRRNRIIDILGRTITLADNGLPEQIDSRFTPEVTAVQADTTPLFTAPLQFTVCDGEGVDINLNWEALQFTRDTATELSFTLTGRSVTPAITVTIEGQLEPDGCLEYHCQLTAGVRIDLADTFLRVFFNAAIVKYILGLGFQGGRIAESWDWVWDTPTRGQDSVWIGCEHAGLQLSLRDDHYQRPLNTNFYTLQPLVSPESWDNGSRGSISFRRTAEDTFSLTCAGGPRTLEAGATSAFNFRLLITPFRPIDTDKQWNTRFYHHYNTPEEIRKTGANIVTIHHAQPVNPYINYPFLRPVELKRYADDIHALGMKLRLYYTVRELTNHAPEIYALRSLGHEIFSPGPGGGHAWLQEHFRDDYIAAWHVFAYECVAVANSGTSRWHNFYVEGLDWLARNMEIDGIYIDDLAFDRYVMKRVRRVLDSRRPGAVIDLHSANQFNPRDGFANSINLYMEHLPYLDKIWLGEYFDYDQGPDYWMTEVAGIPFGTMGEMLQDGGHLWRGMLYGMTNRYPHDKGDPRAVWRVWEEFGMVGSRMFGYWSPACPVRTDRSDLLATVYVRPAAPITGAVTGVVADTGMAVFGPDTSVALIALGSWADEAVELRLDIDWPALAAAAGIPGTVSLAAADFELAAPDMGDYQARAVYAPDQSITIPAAAGALLILKRK